MRSSRANALALFVVALPLACSAETSPGAAPADAAGDTLSEASVATDAAEGCTVPAAVNTLAGQFSVGSPGGEPAWAPKAVYRIERAKDPAHPQIMFLSTAVECAALADEGFDGRIPPTQMLLLELGAAAVGEYSAWPDSPPPSTKAHIYTWSSYTPPNPPFPQQYSRSGSVSVTAHSSADTRGTFFADFVTQPPSTVRVCGRFEARPCTVNW